MIPLPKGVIPCREHLTQKGLLQGRDCNRPETPLRVKARPEYPNGYGLRPKFGLVPETFINAWQRLKLFFTQTRYVGVGLVVNCHEVHIWDRDHDVFVAKVQKAADFGYNADHLAIFGKNDVFDLADLVPI